MTAYSNLGIKLIDTGDEAGAWGTSTNTNLTYIDEAICGYINIPLTTTGTATPNTVDVANFTSPTNDGRNRILNFTSATDLGATSYVCITKAGSNGSPYFEGWYFVRNRLPTQEIIIYQGSSLPVASNYATIPNNTDAIIFCQSGVVNILYASPAFTTLTTSGNATVGGNGTVTGTLDVNGNVAIGATSPTANYRVRILAEGTTSAYYAALFENSTGGNLFYIRADGYVYNYGDFTNAGNFDVDGYSVFGPTSLSTNYTVRISAVGSVSSTSTGPLFCEDSAGTALFNVRSNGDIYTGGLSKNGAPYNNGFSGGKAVYVSSGGLLGYNTSSLKYKKEINDSPYGLTEVMKLRSVSYKAKNSVDSDLTYIGFIAEEVDAIGLKEFVHYKNEEPDSLVYDQMVSLLTKAIQEQQAMIEDLKARVAALGG